MLDEVADRAGKLLVIEGTLEAGVEESHVKIHRFSVGDFRAVTAAE